MCSGIQWLIGKFVGVYEFYRIQANELGGGLSDIVNTCNYAAKMQKYQSPF